VSGGRRWLAAAALVLAVPGCGNPPPAGDGGPAEPLQTAAAVQPVVLDPVVPGWSPVRSVKRAAVYDVPPTWNVLSETTIVGFETKQGQQVAGSGAAEFAPNACGDSSLAIAAIKHDTGTDLARASEATVREWGDLAFRDGRERKPRLTVGEPETITIQQGRNAVVVKAEVRTASPAGDCKLTRGAVYAVSATGFTGELGPTAILVVVADVGLPGVVPEAEIRQILSTLRPT
jgi:hypothetical protein